jgi:hypothetical protein
MWTIDYSHPAVKKFHCRGGKNFTAEREKISPRYNTYNTGEKQQRHTAVGNFSSTKIKNRLQRTTTRGNGGSKKQGVSRTSKVARWEPKDWPEVEKWLASKSQDFQNQVWRHAEYNLNKPKKEAVEYPERYKKGVVWKTWRDYTTGSNDSDFKFVDKTGIKPAPIVRTRQLSYEEKMGADKTFDESMEEEMKKLYGKEVHHG